MSFSLNGAQLDALLEQLPVLAGRPRRLEDLPGGLTNRNVKITTSDAVYVARCSDTSSNLLGIDRDNEYFNSRAAERAGVG
ncbi:MAG: LPS biosynthesis choline kinase, partial [Mycobacterium sp.]